ncbi:MAG: hypothetical protein IKP62_01660 [Salinivirgaceae bacterium]|nr:hypothetical protein [Salinivirgaceae bacterium]
MKKNLDAVINEVSNSPVRSSIITAAALIDTALKTLIERRFIKLDKKTSDNIWKSFDFAAKERIAYAMGLISKELYEDIDSYRKIRNKCAHNFVLDEKSMKSIKDTAKNFKLLKAVFRFDENENVKFYTIFEFLIIFIALEKRINNVDRCEEFRFEAYDDYLKYDNRDYELLTHFDETFKI